MKVTINVIKLRFFSRLRDHTSKIYNLILTIKFVLINVYLKNEKKTFKYITIIKPIGL